MMCSEEYRSRQNIRALLSDLSSFRVSELTLDQADGYLWRIEVTYREFVAMDALGVLGQSGPGVTALQCLAEAHMRMGKVVEELHLCNEQPTAAQVPIVLSGAVGRPRFQISRYQLEFLIQTGFSVPQIAHLLGVSISTVRRRMRDNNLSIHSM